jgi:RNA polymerase sigma-70 factor (ECF subfamily)
LTYPEAPTSLIQRAGRDRTAFGELYDLYVRRVYAFSLTHTRDRDEAEDVTAATFERALNAIGRYQDRGAPLSSWLFRIAANIITDRRRQGSRVSTLGDAPIPEERLDRSPEGDPQEQVERWERAAALRERVETLPEDQRTAIRLRYMEGLSLAEVAERVGRNENATKQLLHRATTSLRARMGGQDV